MSSFLKFFLFGLCLTLPIYSLAQAEDKKSLITDPNAEIQIALDREFNSSITDFGELAGEARACSAEDKLPEHKARVAEIFNKIDQLFGSNRAFLFAAAYGFGSASSPTSDECTSIVDDFQDNYSASAEKYNLID